MGILNPEDVAKRIYEAIVFKENVISTYKYIGSIHSQLSKICYYACKNTSSNNI
jgi:hypothetical protein